MKKILVVLVIFMMGLTACGDSNTSRVTIFFYKNDGSNEQKTQDVSKNTRVNLIKNTFIRTVHEFKGWSTSESGEVEYEDEAAFSMGTSNVSLYAVWEKFQEIEIHTLNDLNSIRDNLSGNYKLMADISLETFGNWVPIGSMSEPFTGLLDGNNHKITNLKIDTPHELYIGLFGVIHNAEIMNLGLEDVNIRGKNSGGIAAHASNSTITNCYSSGKIGDSDYSPDSSGGIVAIMETGTIINSYSTGDIWGGLCGGIAGIANNTTITNSYSTGNVGIDISNFSGGIAGQVRNSTITNSYSAGNVTAYTFSGGITGIADNITITECYSLGTIVSTYAFYCAGGIIGYAYNSIITDSHSKGFIASSYSGGIAGGLHNSIIRNCYSTGNVFTGLNNARVGGIAGIVINGRIINCYSTAHVSGSFAGGIAGWLTTVLPFELNGFSSDSEPNWLIDGNIIINSYSTAHLTASGWSHCLGGIVAFMDSGTITNCYYAGNIITVIGNNAFGGGIAAFIELGTITNNAALSPEILVGGWTGRVIGGAASDAVFTISNNFALDIMVDSGPAQFNTENAVFHGISKTDVELKMQSTYSDSNSLGGLGWKFGNDDDNPWKMPAGGGYPILYWQ